MIEKIEDRLNGEGEPPGANKPFLCFVMEGDYMSWSKLKQQLEGFLSPALNGRVEDRAPGYLYLPDKSGICYISVDKKNVLNMSDKTNTIKWY